MNVVIFDFEVFKYDTLLGTLTINGDNLVYKQMWSLDEIKNFYKAHIDDIWVGHNNDAYDNHILKAIISGKTDIFRLSKHLINQEFRSRADLDIYTYDTMCCNYFSLKLTELCGGKKIQTSEVDFNIDRPLTETEKLETEQYNRADLAQTYENFTQMVDTMLMRLRLLTEFDIPKKFLTATEARLASTALSAEQIPGIEEQYIKPEMYPTLQIKNQAVIDYYQNECFRKKGENRLTVTLCGLPHSIGSGGIHAAAKKCHETNIIYLDVSGYYNLVMINYNLLPRTIPEKGRKLYEYMYHQQLKLKGVDDAKRWVYKTILLSVFGASMNKYTDFYDPQVGSLITMTGQLFLVDLLEKLDGKVKLIQSNTDGIMVKPLPGITEQQILDIVKEWCDRTGFVIKPKHIGELWQRDVNNYCYSVDRLGSMPKAMSERFAQITVKGECVGAYDKPIDLYTAFKLWEIKEPLVIHHCVVNQLMYNVPPEQTVEELKSDLRYFQYICKKQSYDYCMLETTDLTTGITTQVKIDDMNRAFANKDNTKRSMIYKYAESKRAKKAKISNLPDNVFIYNSDITTPEGKAKVMEQIDFDYYVERAYERIAEFIEV